MFRFEIPDFQTGHFETGVTVDSDLSLLYFLDMLRFALLNDVQSQSAALAVVAIKESFLIRRIAQLHRV